jgi:hypothetical protein
MMCVAECVAPSLPSIRKEHAVIIVVIVDLVILFRRSVPSSQDRPLSLDCLLQRLVAIETHPAEKPIEFYLGPVLWRDREQDALVRVPE